MKIEDYYKMVDDAINDLEKINHYRSLYIFAHTKLRVYDIVKIVNRESQETFEESVVQSDEQIIHEIVLKSDHSLRFLLSGLKEEYLENQLLRIKKGTVSNSSVAFGGKNTEFKTRLGDEYKEITLEILNSMTKGSIDNFLNKINVAKKKFRNCAPFKVGQKVKVVGYEKFGTIQRINNQLDGSYVYILTTKENGYNTMVMNPNKSNSGGFKTEELEKHE